MDAKTREQLEAEEARRAEAEFKVSWEKERERKKEIRPEAWVELGQGP